MSAEQPEKENTDAKAEDTKPETQQNPPAPPPQTQTTTSLTPNLTDRWLWLDPFTIDQNLKSRTQNGSVLLAEDIKKYILDYNTLVEKEDFLSGGKIGAKLKGASYTMTPDEGGAWIYLLSKPNELPHQQIISPKIDDVGPYYLIPKNSLVYIKIKQRLRIPFYMIGRHNLKIRYVYQGLLLGTGPQVDPGFRGHLFIPLHNFTTSDVILYIEQSFISIDFTRTTEFSFNGQKEPSSLDDLYNRFEKEKHLIDRSKVEERVTISKYLEGKKPRSQMGQFQYDFEKMEERLKLEFKKLEETKKELKWERFAVFVALVSFLIGIGSCIYASLNYYRGFVADFKTETDRVKNIATTINVTPLENQISLLKSNQLATLVEWSNQLNTAIFQIHKEHNAEEIWKQNTQVQIDSIQHTLSQLRINTTNSDKKIIGSQQP